MKIKERITRTGNENPIGRRTGAILDEAFSISEIRFPTFDG